MKNEDWFDKHIIVDFGDFNNKEDKKKADDLKQKLKEKLEEELKDEWGEYSRGTKFILIRTFF